MEIMQVKTSGSALFTSDWYKEGSRNMERFLKAYTTVSDLIRDHIAKLAIARQ
jgi:hypothetical protein